MINLADFLIGLSVFNVPYGANANPTSFTCFAASTANLTGYTYDNGASGLGATLTAPSTGAFALDGTSPGIGAQILYKNDTTGSGAYNGIYVVTVPGDGSTAAVLTRSANYNSPSEINKVGIISIINGTLNSGTAWFNTSSVIAVGVTPIVYDQFNPFVGILNPAQGGTGVNNGASTITIGGNFSLIGAHTFSGTLTGNTAITFPTSGVLSADVQVQQSAFNFSVTAGAGDNYTVTLNPPAASYTDGLTVVLQANRTNTTISPTINVDGLGPIDVVVSGSSPLIGDIHQNGVYEFIYSLPNNQFELVNPSLFYASSDLLQSNFYISSTDTGVVNGYVGTIPSNLSQVPSEFGVYYIGISNTNTGPATLDLNSSGPKSITNLQGSALSGGELLAGTIAQFVYNGTSYQLQNSAASGFSFPLLPSQGGTGVSNSDVNTLTINGISTIDQDVSTTGQPTFADATITNFATALSFINGYTTTLNTGSTTTLINSSTYGQVFKGILNQSISLPDVTTLIKVGQGYFVNNLSSADMIIYASGGTTLADTVGVLPSMSYGFVTYNGTVATDNTSWDYAFTTSTSGGITTLDGDTGSATGSTVSIITNALAGGTVAFTGDNASTLTFSVTDGDSNTFVGANAGLSGILGSNNVVFGSNSLVSIATGSNNNIFGVDAFQNLITGSFNIGLGVSSGSNYSTSESSNIIINNPGVAAENNVLRIGVGTGTGNQQLAQAYIAGIYGNTVSNGQYVMTVDSTNDQLGSLAYSSLVGASNLMSRDANGNSAVNIMYQNITSYVSDGTTRALSNASSPIQVLTGTMTETYQLPNAPSIFPGLTYRFYNYSTQNMTIEFQDATFFTTVLPGAVTDILCTANGTANGTWEFASHVPSTSSFGAAGLAVGGYLLADTPIYGYANTVTSGTPYILALGDFWYQTFTGSLAQDVILPLYSTLQAGVAYFINNLASADVNVYSSGGISGPDLVVTITPNSYAYVIYNGGTTTDATSWDLAYNSGGLTTPIATVDGGTGLTTSGGPAVYTVSSVVGQAGFISIQDAIDQAVTDGASSSTPACVWIFAGHYTEDLTLKAWVSLAGACDPSEGSILVTGNAIFPDTTNGNMTISNVGFATANGAAAISFQDSTASNVHLQSVNIDAAGGIGFECTGSGMTIDGSIGTIVAGSGGSCINITNGFVEILASSSTYTDTQSTVSGGELRVFGSDLADSFNVQGGIAEFIGTYVNSGSLECFLIGASGAVYAQSAICNSNAISGNFVTGTGNFIYSDVSTVGGSIGIDPLLILTAQSTYTGTQNILGEVVTTTGAGNGSLDLTPITNTSGDFFTAISNDVAVAQDQTISIPDSGIAASKFLLTDSAAGVQQLTSNLAAVNLIPGYSTTVTSLGTTVLSASSTYIQHFTGPFQQIVQFPVVSTLITGQSFLINNQAAQGIVLQSSAGAGGINAIGTVNAGTYALVTFNGTAGTGAASWDLTYTVGTVAIPVSPAQGGTGVANAFNLTIGAPSSINQDVSTAGSPTFTAMSTSVGAISAQQGNVVAGSNGHAGLLASYAPGGSLGWMGFKAINNAGNFIVTVSNASFAQSSTVSIPDPGVATSTFVLADSATTYQTINSPVASTNFVNGYASTINTATTTTLTVASKQQQTFTGSTTQNVVLPNVTTLSNGWSYTVNNQSTFAVTVYSSAGVGGGNIVSVIPASVTQTIVFNGFPGVSPASWDVVGFNQNLSTTGSPTFTAMATSSGSITAQQGNVVAGSNGHGGLLATYAPGSSLGWMGLQANNNIGNYIITLTNNPFSQSSSIYIPDPGAISAHFVLDTGASQLQAASSLLFDKGTGTVSGGAVTINAQAGVITTPSLTTVAGGAFAFTLTNSLVTTSSVIIASYMGGTNTLDNLTIRSVATSSGTATFTITNNDPLLPFNGTLIVGYQIL